MEDSARGVQTAAAKQMALVRAQATEAAEARAAAHAQQVAALEARAEAAAKRAEEEMAAAAAAHSAQIGALQEAHTAEREQWRERALAIEAEAEDSRRDLHAKLRAQFDASADSQARQLAEVTLALEKAQHDGKFGGCDE